MPKFSFFSATQMQIARELHKDEGRFAHLPFKPVSIYQIPGEPLLLTTTYISEKYTDKPWWNDTQSMGEVGSFMGTTSYYEKCPLLVGENLLESLENGLLDEQQLELAGEAAQLWINEKFKEAELKAPDADNNSITLK